MTEQELQQAIAKIKELKTAEVKFKKIGMIAAARQARQQYEQIEAAMLYDRYHQRRQRPAVGDELFPED